jgi:DNA-directed RNA polymerase subunit K/omega
MTLRDTGPLDYGAFDVFPPKRFEFVRTAAGRAFYLQRATLSTLERFGQGPIIGPLGHCRRYLFRRKGPVRFETLLAVARRAAFLRIRMREADGEENGGSEGQFERDRSR